MRDLSFPSCFGENGVQIADSSYKNPQNVVTCVYNCKLFSQTCLITVVWSRNMMGQCLSVEINDQNHQLLCKFDVKPFLFSKKKGSKFLETNSSKIDLFWDFSVAKFDGGPEPLEGFYLALVCKSKMVLLIGDLKKEAFKKTNSIPSQSHSIYVSKKEHIFGKRVFCTRAQFYDYGPVHSLSIEFEQNMSSDSCLIIRVDSKIAVKVKRLQWKFRGNDTICIDGLPVELFYDVHEWLFGLSGNAVFMFQTCFSAEKMWSSEDKSDELVPHWACLDRFKETKKMPGLGFSLVLYAWKEVRLHQREGACDFDYADENRRLQYLRQNQYLPGALKTFTATSTSLFLWGHKGLTSKDTLVATKVYEERATLIWFPQKKGMLNVATNFAPFVASIRNEG